MSYIFSLLPQYSNGPPLSPTSRESGSRRLQRRDRPEYGALKTQAPKIDGGRCGRPYDERLAERQRQHVAGYSGGMREGGRHPRGRQMLYHRGDAQRSSQRRNRPNEETEGEGGVRGSREDHAALPGDAL